MQLDNNAVTLLTTGCQELISIKASVSCIHVSDHVSDQNMPDISEGGRHNYNYNYDIINFLLLC